MLPSATGEEVSKEAAGNAPTNFGSPPVPVSMRSNMQGTCVLFANGYITY